MNLKFEKAKLEKELKRSGVDYEVKRKGKNEFGEPSDEPIVVGTIRGIYHVQSSTIQEKVNEAARTRSVKLPMILCLYEDATNLGLEIGDFIILNGKEMVINGITNVQEWGIIGDISLEVTDDGKQVDL